MHNFFTFGFSHLKLSKLGGDYIILHASKEETWMSFRKRKKRFGDNFCCLSIFGFIVHDWTSKIFATIGNIFSRFWKYIKDLGLFCISIKGG